MWRRKKRNLYVKQKHSIRGRLLIVLSLFSASLLVLVFSVASREKTTRPDSPACTYASRFAQKKNLRQSVYSTTYSIRSGDTFYQIAADHGVDLGEVGELLAACRPFTELQKLKPGEELQFFFHKGSQRLAKVRYLYTAGQVLAIARVGRGWTASTYAKPLVIVHALAQGTIEESLYQSAMAEKIDFELAMALADIFAWDIDFFVDLRPGDRYAFMYEKHYRDGKVVGNGRITAAHFSTDSIDHRAYRYRVTGRGADYYDKEGNSLRKQFLKSPLRYSRISSGFSKRRLHPILKIYRPHPGIDYAAPTGTPVVSLGDGRVTYKGWKNGYGKFIVIRHNNRYTTTYGHLSRYASGLTKGASVNQGQVIGYVGATGLATGPHLDFRMKKDGRFVDPRKVSFPAARPVPAEHMSDFKERVAKLEEEFDFLLSRSDHEKRPEVSLAVSGNL
jgi:murein DD-endopeptidase MepM/ murein hydrolase activator NlpD